MKLQLKRSNVLVSGGAKVPTAAQLDYGELAINYSAGDASIFLKDSTNNVIRIAGVGNIADDGLTNVPTTTSPPTTPTPEAGNLWYNSEDGRLYIYYVDDNSSQWVDASPDTWQTTVIPDTTNPAHQAGTLDDRYVNINGDTLTGALKLDSAASAAAPDLAFDSDLNTGIFSPGADSLAITTGGTQRFTVDSSGRVGIGTSSPVNKLDVNGSVSATGTMLNTGYAPAIHIGVDGGIPTIASGNNAASTYLPIVFTRDSTTARIESMRIDSSGNVGIGTTSPQRNLHIHNPISSANTYLQLTSATTGTGSTDGFQLFAYGSGSNTNAAIVQRENAALEIWTNNTERMRIDSSGNVGLGTSTFTAASSGRQILEINGTASALINLDVGGTRKAYYFTDGTDAYNYNTANGSYIFGTNDIERLRIDSSGNVGIGTTAPAGTLSIYKASNPYLYFQNSASGTGTNDGFSMVYAGSDMYIANRENGILAYESPAGSERFRIDSSGNVGIGVTSVHSSRRVEIKQPSSYSAALRILADGNGNDGNLQWFSGLSQYEIGITQGTDALKFQRNGTERMRIDSSGNVGIGTTSPGSKLAVFDSSAAVFRLETPGVIAISHSFDGTDYTINNNDGSSGHPIIFGTKAAGAESMRIDNSGKVGIGTSSPGNPLHIKNDYPIIRLEATASGYVGRNTIGGFQNLLSIDCDNDNAIANSATVFNVDGSERLRIDSSGRLLLGTTTEGYPFADTLTIAESGHAGITIRSGTTSNGAVYFSDATSGTGEYDGWVDYSHNNRAMQFGVAANERMRIDSSGRLLVGGTSAYVSDANFQVTDDTNAKFVISNPGNASYSLAVGTDNALAFKDESNALERMRILNNGKIRVKCSNFATDPSSSNPGLQLFDTSGGAITSAGSGSGAESHLIIINTNGVVGQIKSSGSATLYQTSSDYRLKENVVDLDGAITRVKQLAPKRFNFIADDTTTLDGFIAHEAQTVVPEAVTGEKDGEEMQGIDQSKLVPLLTAALQEAIAKIETLEQRLSDAGIA